MKKLFKSLLFVSAAILASCENSEDIKLATSFEVDIDSPLVFQTEGGSKIITITTPESVEWKVTTCPEWCSPTPSMGTGLDKELELIVAANQTTSELKGSMTLTASEDGREFKHIQFRMAQNPSGPFVIVDDEEKVISLSASGITNGEITLRANVAWSAKAYDLENGDTEASWITIDKCDQANSKLVYSVNINDDKENARQGRIVISSQSNPEIEPITINITQERMKNQKSITVNGMINFLPDGDGTMVLEKDGQDQTININVANSETATSITLKEEIEDATYRMISATIGAKTVAIDGMVTFIADIPLASHERWDSPTQQFGGESADRPVKIKNKEDLSALAATVNQGNNYSGIYLKQTSDIDLSSLANWKPIGKEKTAYFAGNYDGGNMAITGMKIDATNINAPNFGLFGVVQGEESFKAVVKNVNLKSANKGLDIYVPYAKGFTGSIAAIMHSNATIDNCTSDLKMKVGWYSGGIVGAVRVDARPEDAWKRALPDPIPGVDAKSLSLSNCQFSGEITIHKSPEVEKNPTTGLNCGAIAGVAYADITACGNTGNVINEGGECQNIAGIAGVFGGDMERCFNEGRVEGGKSACGGLIGYIKGGMTVKLSNSYSTGDIVPSTVDGINTIAGGLFGTLPTNNKQVESDRVKLTIENCYSTSKGVNKNVGALVGKIDGNGLEINPEGEGGILTANNVYFPKDADDTGNNAVATSMRSTLLGSGWGALTTNAMLEQASYVGFDFNNIWTMEGGDTPKLK